MVYISEEQIGIRFRRYRALNAARLKKALSVMSYDARLCLSVVPVLLHYNHISLPGYRKGYVPHGIDMFTPDVMQRRYIDECLSGSVFPLEEPEKNDILALYAMGSTSSVGQGKGSDLDLWVCVRANLSGDALQALTDKCSLISTYAKAYGVELNLFVTSEDRFTNFHPDSLDEENCGSAQNIFLLDEFYRTCIRLCGRYIVWFMISSKEEREDYYGYVNYLLYRDNPPPEALVRPQLCSHAEDQKTVGNAVFSESKFTQSVLLMRFILHDSLIHKIENEIQGKHEDGAPQLRYSMLELLMAHQALTGMEFEESRCTCISEDGERHLWHEPHFATEDVGSVGDDFIMKSILTAVMHMTRDFMSPEEEGAQDEYAAEAAREEGRDAEFPEQPISESTRRRQAAAVSIGREVPSVLFSELDEESDVMPPLGKGKTGMPAGAREEMEDRPLTPFVQPPTTEDSSWSLHFNDFFRALTNFPWFQQSAQALRKNLQPSSLLSAMGVAPSPFAMMTYLNMQRIPESMRTLYEFFQQRYNDSSQKEQGKSEETIDWRVAVMQRAILYALNIDDRVCPGSFEQKNKQKIFKITPEEWFDFGMVVRSSPAEYFGSGLWLLYKAIDSPFKVVLKILLMEAYSFDYPNTLLLSSELKDYMLSHDGYSLRLDAYYLMYLRVSHYLRFRKEQNRLTLMRKCFYIKIFLGLNDRRMYSNADYLFRCDLLEGFKHRWGWSDTFVHDLEQVASWKMAEVRDFNEEVYSSLIESYRTLLNFSIRQGIEYAITSDDAGVLSRKLYAAFETYPGKIIVLHSSFSNNIEERHLCFIHPSQNSLCRAGWHLYASSPENSIILSTKVSYVAHRLCMVVAWACFNGLMTPRTLIHVAGDYGPVSPMKIRNLGSDIVRVLMSRRCRVNEKVLTRIRGLKSALIILNLEKDETGVATNRTIDIDIGSTLSCGRQHLCLIGSVDLLLLNSWGELRSIHFPTGEAGVVELLATLLRIIGNSINNGDEAQEILRSVEVCSYADVNQDLIKYDLEFIINQVFNCMRSNESSEFVFEVGRGTYVAREEEDRGVIITKRSNIGASEYETRILCRYGMRPENSIQVPAVVDRYATAGIVQYFFSPKEHGCWDIYIINERNGVEIVRNYRGSRAALVNRINKICINSGTPSDQGKDVFFNLPQYFVLSQDLSSIHPFTIRNA